MLYKEELLFINETKNKSKKEVEKTKKKLYYSPETGYCGINEMVRKSGYSYELVKNFLDSQDTYTKHKPAKHIYPRNRVFVNKIDDQFQADLVEMIEYEKKNKGYRYLLTCIDIFSKYAWGIPLKNKTGNATVKAFEIIFKERVPNKLQTDLGKEFYNSKIKQFLSKYNINHFSSDSPLKAFVVERFNRTLKEKMWKYFSEVKHHCWVDVIDNFLSNYNHSYHRSIKMTPTEASKKTKVK